MGTRSLTYIVDGEKPIACMYQQFDGYLGGTGHDIGAFLNGKAITNGLDGQGFNGIGDLGARLLAALKANPNEAGGQYLVDPTTGQVEEYNYFVSILGDYFKDPGACTIQIVCRRGDYKDGKESLGEEIFRGSPAALMTVVETDEEDE